MTCDPLLRCSAIGPDFWKPSVIGDFTEAEARKFLQWELDSAAGKGMIKVNDLQWAEIYEVSVNALFHEPMMLDPHLL